MEQRSRGFFGYVRRLGVVHCHGDHSDQTISVSDGPSRTPREESKNLSRKSPRGKSKKSIAGRTRSRSRKRTSTTPKKKKTKVKMQEKKNGKSDVDSVGARLSIFADAMHNFTDGMAIAAAFNLSNPLGYSTTFAVMIHEIPHEMGDFAVLMSYGYSKRDAFLSQFVSASGTFLGCAFGLAMGNLHPAYTFPSEYALAFTAGGFIYIALVEISPKLLQRDAPTGQCAVELLAALAGVGVMVVVGAFE
eukprot:g3791.t1